MSGQGYYQNIDQVREFFTAADVGVLIRDGIWKLLKVGEMWDSEATLG
jgi:hypothetical protein